MLLLLLQKKEKKTLGRSRNMQLLPSHVLSPHSHHAGSSIYPMPQQTGGELGGQRGQDT